MAEPRQDGGRWEDHDRVSLPACLTHLPPASRFQPTRAGAPHLHGLQGAEDLLQDITVTCNQ